MNPVSSRAALRAAVFCRTWHFLAASIKNHLTNQMFACKTHPDDLAWLFEFYFACLLGMMIPVE